MGLKLTSESAFRRMVDLVLATSKADDTFVSLSDSESATLRFANNQVVQHVSVHEPSVTVRAAFGRQAGSATTNRLDRNSLVQTVRQAERIARLTPEDPEYLSPLGKQEYLEVPAFRSSTAAAAPLDLARRAGNAVDRCAERELTGAGIVSTTVSAGGVAASTGLFAYDQSTEAEFSLTATATGGDASGWAFNTHRDIEALGVAARVASAVEKAVRSGEPRELPPGHYPVILEPAAVAGVFGPLLFALDAKSYHRGNSALSGKLNTEIVDPRLTIRTDPGHADLMGRKFDMNGLPTRPQSWVDRGALKQLYYDRFTAREHGVEPSSRPSAPILTVEAPLVPTLEELIAGTKRAVLITNFWYIRSVDPADLTLTGMTRDGTFLVEDGRIVHAVRNFRFHDSPLRCFRQIDAATPPLESVTMERGKMLLPAVRLPDFHLSSVTRF
ncbi:MAG: TldD/PmbA family protein [Planctomycetes bacterium]|nr:TldD/PmbA family protein [Planctomycetota bacterium]